ncbi:unnamed protein product [Paramecium sonneborni]|uniref:Uncharacterized protein n=1 Tax=Paramecium sonneborni TaxID=65129 RepID=A0A8S1RW96_9CILI|nr:unnamed protein product [Paramecium sonneborni]
MLLHKIYLIYHIILVIMKQLQFQSLDHSHRQHSYSVAIQTDSKKKFLSKLNINKKIPTQYSSSVNHGNNQFKYHSFSNSPNTRGTELSNKSHRHQNQKNLIDQFNVEVEKQINPNIWAIKMNKYKIKSLQIQQNMES